MTGVPSMSCLLPLAASSPNESPTTSGGSRNGGPIAHLPKVGAVGLLDHQVEAVPIPVAVLFVPADTGWGRWRMPERAESFRLKFQACPLYLSENACLFCRCAALAHCRIVASLPLGCTFCRPGEPDPVPSGRDPFAVSDSGRRHVLRASRGSSLVPCDPCEEELL
jgi:hypothetical protein